METRAFFVKVCSSVNFPVAISRAKLHPFFQFSFLNGWSYKFLVGLIWKISSCSFHTSYNFLFLISSKQWYMGFCVTMFLFHGFNHFTVFFSFSFLNDKSDQELVGLRWKISSLGFQTSYNLLFFKQNKLSYKGLCTTSSWRKIKMF